jgi:hypothetical protein
MGNRNARRDKVSELDIKGFSPAEIQERLEEEGIVNPNTGKPWRVETIYRDLRVLREGWKSLNFGAVEHHRARVWSELQLVKRFAWKREDMRTVLGAIGQERDLLNLDSEKRQRHEVFIKGYAVVSPDDWDDPITDQPMPQLPDQDSSV